MLRGVGVLPTVPAGLLLLALLPLTLRPQGAGSTAAGTRDGPARDSSGLFRPLPLPEPDLYRTASGEPGPEYWQQSVDYEIDVRLKPASRVVQGSETITYTNESPHPLRELWLQLDQNLFDPSSGEPQRLRRGRAHPNGGYEDGGYEVSDVTVRQGDRTAAAEYEIDGTVMSVSLPQELSPNGGRVRLSLDFRFEIPSSGAGRMGYMDVEDGTVFQLAQWYPRMFVYDDVHGWNVMPYLGRGEFYLEYGSFDVSVTVPRDFVVVSTGTLQNPAEVLTGVQRERLERARESRTPVRVIRREEVGDPSTRPGGEGPLTWRFRADSVRDFAWAASQAFIWDAAAWDDVLLMSVYPEEGLGSNGEDGWERSTGILRHSVRYYSEKWEPYPYPVAISVGGRVGGMEYPMVVFCSVRARGEGLFRVTDHEIGHAWFPMLVGSDERRHVWMDEGVTSFMGLYSPRAYRGGPMQVGTGAMIELLAKAMEEHRSGAPILTHTDRIPRGSYGYLGYGKPSMALVVLREYVLGPERFDAALREYIDRWKYRHPKPADFFRTIEDVTGEDLVWFWQGWFNSSKTLDQAVADVSVTGDTTWITLENRRKLVMPVKVRIEYADGSHETRRIPVDVWRRNDSHVFFLTAGKVRGVQVDPEHQLPDVDRGNNVW